MEADSGRDNCLANWQLDSLVLILVLIAVERILATGRQ